MDPTALTMAVEKFISTNTAITGKELHTWKLNKDFSIVHLFVCIISKEMYTDLLIWVLCL